MRRTGSRLFRWPIFFRAKIVDVSKESLLIELTGNQSKIEAFIDLLNGYEILELARTGITGQGLTSWVLDQLGEELTSHR